MKNILFRAFALVAALAIFGSCNNSSDNGPSAKYVGYATLVTDGFTYSFMDDAGENYYVANTQYLGDYSTTNSEGVSKDGNRVVIWYDYADVEPPMGFDHSLTMFGIYDILSKDVEVATTATEVAAAGDTQITVTSMNLSGNWLDIVFNAYTGPGFEHKLTLLDNQTVTPPADMPAGYTYLEFRHDDGNGDALSSATTIGEGYVSYRLSDKYNPAISGSGGLYIRIQGQDMVLYQKIDAVAPVALN